MGRGKIGHGGPTASPSQGGRDRGLPAHPRYDRYRPAESWRHLEAVIAAFVDHYNRTRPHRGLELAQPPTRPVTPITSGKVIRRDVLGGIIHEYETAA